jgi:alkaline phosphatase
MNKRQLAVLIVSAMISAVPAFSQAKNAILFIGDGAGVQLVNAASIYAYGKPQALYIQSMPHMALADTSTTREWVVDGPAASTAWATGVKTHNGIVSESDTAERGVKDGENLKTIVEYAEERGFSTGLISNLRSVGVSDPTIAASYAHLNKPPRRFSGETFLQLLNMKYGDGPDVVIGTGRQIITEQVTKNGLDLSAEIHKRGYTYLDSLAAVSKLDPTNSRLIALLNDPEFDLNEAFHQAVSRLSRNSKGFVLIVLADCHGGWSPEKTLERMVTYDNAIRAITEEKKKDTLVMFAGNFSVDLHVTGENLIETLKSSDHRKIADITYLGHQHTAEETPVMAVGPGSERLKGYILNTDIFHVMMKGIGFEP